MYAITAHAREREAHLREVGRHGQTLPKALTAANRQDIAVREARLATRLRAVEHAYRTALDHDEALTATPSLEVTVDMLERRLTCASHL
jgi:hypothetical protein